MVKKVIFLVIIGGLAAGNMVQCCHVGIAVRAHPTLDDIGKVGLCVGAAGLATYGLVKIGKWIFSQTNEQCLEKARQRYVQAHNDYTSLLNILALKYQGCTDTTSCLYDISESTLYQVATLICPRAPSGYAAISSNYIKNVRKTIDQLAYCEDSLTNRLYEFNTQNPYDPEVIRLRTLMDEMVKQIRALLSDLRFTYDYLSHHKSYLQLFETEFFLMARYDHELHDLDLYGNDYVSLSALIHQAVMVYQRDHRDLYPYSKYLQRVEEDLKVLIDAMHRLSYNYYYRLQAAENLRNKLEAIRHLVAGAPAYSEELRAYEYARMTAAAIAAQRESARALENQAQAIEEQARAARDAAEELQRVRELQEKYEYQDDDEL